MPRKPTYEELEQRILKLTETIQCHKKADNVAFPQFETHHAVILIIEPESGQIVNANLAAQNFYGFSVDTLKKMTIQEINILPPEKVAEKRLQASNEKQNFFEFPHRLSNGKVRTVHVHSSPILLNGTKLLLSIIHDVTDRKLAEKSLRESEERFRSIVENTDAGYFFIDKKGIICKVNSAWVKMYRYNSADEVIGKHFTNIQTPADTEKAAKFIEKILGNDPEYTSGEFSRKCSDGSTGFHTFSARPVTVDNKIIGLEGFILDTTERRKAEDHNKLLIQELQKALSEVKTLRGCLPICAHCKKIREDDGYWNQIETYLHQHSNIEFTHGICPECAKKLYPDLDLFDDDDSQDLK